MQRAFGIATLLGAVIPISAFECNFRGTGATYTSRIQINNGIGGDDSWAWAQTTPVVWADGGTNMATCCQCGYLATDGADGDENVCFEEVDGFQPEFYPCDGFRPDISIDPSAAQPSTPDLWFTSEAQLFNYLGSSISCSDDCDVGGAMPQKPEVAFGAPTFRCAARPNIFDGGCCRVEVTGECENTAIFVTATDPCGNLNSNAGNSFLVRSDFLSPTVTVEVPEFSPHPYKFKWEKLPITTTVNDNCDDNPLVSITIYSDEDPLSKDYDKEAVLERRYTNKGVDGAVDGWDVTLSRVKQATKTCSKHDVACDEVNGRFYVVRVCAQDRAGHITCDEDTVGVPPKGFAGAGKKARDPIYDGKLYVLAKDILYWNRPATELPVRVTNTGLDA